MLGIGGRTHSALLFRKHKCHIFLHNKKIPSGIEYSFYCFALCIRHQSYSQITAVFIQLYLTAEKHLLMLNNSFCSCLFLNMNPDMHTKPRTNSLL